MEWDAEECYKVVRQPMRTRLARRWALLSTLVLFPRFAVGSTFYLSSSGGGLPGRHRLKLSRDACLI